MKSIVKWVLLACLGLVLSGVGGFFGLGGMQVITVIAGPQLPTAAQPGSPATDLEFLRTAVLANERGVTRRQRERFLELVDADPAPASAEQLTLVAARALSAFDNAHTTVVAPLMRRLPVRFHWTADALIIVKARPEYASLVGRRVVALGGRTPEEMLAAMPELVGGGTTGWVRYRSEYYFSAPAALALTGAEVEGHAVELRSVDAFGVEESLILTADPEPMRGDPFWDFLNAMPGDAHFDTEGWVTLLRRDQSLPLYQREPERLFLVEDLPEHNAVYLRMNAAIDDEMESIRQFAQRAMSQIEASRPRNIIVDFRHNRGGDYIAVLPLVRALSGATPEEGRLYLITGPNTFSAGLLAGSQFKRHIPDRLTVVGQEAGDHLRFRGEGMLVRLPATGVEVYLSTAWDDVAETCGWFDDCWPPNKFFLRGVGGLDPDINVANTWQSYAGGQDLVVEAIFADIARRSVETQNSP